MTTTQTKETTMAKTTTEKATDTTTAAQDAECLRCGFQDSRDVEIDGRADSHRAADGCSRCGSHDVRCL